MFVITSLYMVITSLYMQLHVMVTFNQIVQNRFTKINDHEFISFV